MRAEAWAGGTAGGRILPKLPVLRPLHAGPSGLARRDLLAAKAPIRAAPAAHRFISRRDRMQSGGNVQMRRRAMPASRAHAVGANLFVTLPGAADVGLRPPSLHRATSSGSRWEPQDTARFRPMKWGGDVQLSLALSRGHRGLAILDAGAPVCRWLPKAARGSSPVQVCRPCVGARRAGCRAQRTVALRKERENQRQPRRSPTNDASCRSCRPAG